LLISDYRQGLETYAIVCFPEFKHFTVKQLEMDTSGTDSPDLKDRFVIVCNCCGKDFKPGGTVKSSVHPKATLANFFKHLNTAAHLQRRGSCSTCLLPRGK
jgi:hypothetical protein